jgi:hypothetical protein
MSFPADKPSFGPEGLMADRPAEMWKRPSEHETSPSLFGQKGINHAAANQG